MENSLGRSLRFGRVAGSVIVLCRLGRLTEAEARAIVLAGESAPARDGTALGPIGAVLQPATQVLPPERLPV